MITTMVIEIQLHYQYIAESGFTGVDCIIMKSCSCKAKISRCREGISGVMVVQDPYRTLVTYRNIHNSDYFK